MWAPLCVCHLGALKHQCATCEYIKGFGGDNTIWLDIGTALTPRASDCIAPAHVLGAAAASVEREKQAQ